MCPPPIKRITPSRRRKQKVIRNELTPEESARERVFGRFTGAVYVNIEGKRVSFGIHRNPIGFLVRAPLPAISDVLLATEEEATLLKQHAEKGELHYPSLIVIARELQNRSDANRERRKQRSREKSKNK
ncbi:MAG TPA: hypothetical protein VFF13_00425 [archaeon]|nr:hypothetical protein [archaeon]